MTETEDEIRFWSKVALPKTGDACWLWTAGKNTDGYGNYAGFSRSGSAHRGSFELNYGRIPNGLSVLHRCDNRACVNPAHLFLGTQLDNINDMVRKGRSRAPVGSAHSESKLDEISVAVIRVVYQKTVFGLPTIAKWFGVTFPTIHKAVTRKTWKHVPDNYGLVKP